MRSIIKYMAIGTLCCGLLGCVHVQKYPAYKIKNAVISKWLSTKPLGTKIISAYMIERRDGVYMMTINYKLLWRHKTVKYSIRTVGDSIEVYEIGGGK